MFDMCMLQETKRESFAEFLIHNLWGHRDVEWVHKESRGLSGGLLSVWNKDFCSFRHSFTGDGFLGICVEWKDTLVYFVNIYFACSLAGKRKLWRDLIDFKLLNTPGEWCLGGDFNSITKVSKRSGSSNGSSNKERTEFAQFIDAMELVDIPVFGKKFTWSNSDNSAMSRLDRFLLSEGLIEKGGISNQWVGGRDISDHHPIWLECSNINWGPKPFKFNNFWLDHPDFIPFVKATWESMNIHGKKAFILKEKLKRLKEVLKTWNREVFGIMDLDIEKTVKDLNEVEEMIANGDCHPLFSNAKDLSKKFWEQLHNKESRRRSNRIVKLRKGNGWIQGVAEIKNEAQDHFSKHFSEEWHNRPFLNGINFNTLSVIDNCFLLDNFSEEEVRETVWSCDGNKSPGPDGYNINFLKACWSIVKDHVMVFLNEFHNNAHLPKVVTASFLTLVPKKDHPQDLFDYRPICLIGSLYKILAKLLANRLKKVLGKLISNCQSAFLPQRQILDGVVVLNEIIDLAKKRKDDALSWQWTEQLSATEEQQAIDLTNLLVGFSLQPGITDHWRWIPDTNGLYSVKSCYNTLLCSRQLVDLDQNVLNAINLLWKKEIPSKVLIFAWRLLLERLPTRTALHRRGIILNPQDLHCVFCSSYDEDSAHLFFHCSVLKRVWEEVFKWFGKSYQAEADGWNHFNIFGSLLKTKRFEKVRHLIWLATTWSIWKLRNNVVFNGVTLSSSSLVNDIKTISCLWLSGRYGHISSISFPDWCFDPMTCFQSIF
ncbi:hypothetical protein TSUD_188430 [Trifolium subterraneum]|uniref:Reverse transcriptase domain-containing protein n=1 Tax=Trifolium subterraneum TaxID=3900 RepID=A0A2Z6P1D0_TRISU|nr:hypothetical protein TSUD_188430 [Trifolium subterraneum]